MSEQLYDSFSHAGNKELLKEDLSYRISDSINHSGNLFRALMLADVQQVDHTEDFKVLRALKTQVSTTESPVLKRAIKRRYDKLYEELNKEQPKPEKIINQETYLEFLEYFWELWIESKDHITKWPREDLKQDITTMFWLAKEGDHSPSTAHRQHEEYMGALRLSGITNFSSKSFKKGQQFRGSIG